MRNQRRILSMVAGIDVGAALFAFSGCIKQEQESAILHYYNYYNMDKAPISKESCPALTPRGSIEADQRCFPCTFYRGVPDPSLKGREGEALAEPSRPYAQDHSEKASFVL